MEYLIAIVIAVSVVIGAYFKGSKAGQVKEREKQSQAVIKAIDKARKADAEISTMSDDDVMRELFDKYSR